MKNNMVKPLYPLSDISPDKKKKLKEAKLAKEKARKEFILSLVKNPYLVSVILVIFIFGVVLIIHSNRAKNTLNTSASVSGKIPNVANRRRVIIDRYGMRNDRMLMSKK